MIRRLLLFAGAMFVILAASVAPAHAQYAPGGATALTPTVAPGGTATVTACCFAPGSTVTFSADGMVLDTAVADADGNATGSFVVPAGLTGNVAVVVAGTSSTGAPLTLTTTVAVAAGTGMGTGTGNLPTTGTNLSLPLSIGGAALVAVGGLVVLTTRRRAGSDLSV